MIIETFIHHTSAGCNVCSRLKPKWRGRDCGTKAREHHDQTGHSTWVRGKVETIYAKPLKRKAKQ